MRRKYASVNGRSSWSVTGEKIFAGYTIVICIHQSTIYFDFFLFSFGQSLYAPVVIQFQLSIFFFPFRYFFSPTEKYLHHSLFNLISRDLFWLAKVYFDQLSFIFDSLTYPDESIFVLTSRHLHWTDKICFY